MGLNLYMVGVVVEDMDKSVEFYRRLGVDIPEESVNPYHVGIEMGGMTFFLSGRKTNAIWDPANTPVSGKGYRILLEFYLETQAAVDAKYHELIGYGYESHLAPFITPYNMYFGFVNDPDGNTILLTGEVDKAED